MKSKSVVTVLAVAVVAFAYGTTGVSALWCGCQRNGINTNSSNKASGECCDSLSLSRQNYWGNTRCDAGPDVNSNINQDGDPSSQPLPSIGSPPSPTYASKAAGIRNMHKLKLHPVFTDLAESHLAPKEARLGDLVNPRAVAYIAPRTISPGAFSDAARSTHSTLFQAHSDLDHLHIISNMSYTCADGVHHRIEIVYHESLDPIILSTTPIMYDGTK
ncbi:hypothetical protein BKA57DRAFT_525587 [Linnemannia elongata]|nr:hypothetical protein BKA57DRAFT_525587 [Linnemannia elongata]